MTDFVEQILEDLQRFSPDLVDPGLAPAMRAATQHGPPPSVAAIVRAVEDLNRLLPRLLEEAHSVDGSSAFELRDSHYPLRASLSRRPADYDLHNGHWFPKRFEAVCALQEPDRSALRFLLHWVSVLEGYLSPVLRRTHKQVEVARLARAGGSEFAEEDQRGLTELDGYIRAAARQLERMGAGLRATGGAGLRASSAAPRPYPRSPAWIALKRLCVRWADGVSLSLDALRTQFLGGTRCADLPYLYQRWCGVKLLEALQGTGLEASGDVVGALYLGGSVPLSDGSVSLTLWVEPRLTHARAQATGFRCRGQGEVTPDYMLVLSGPHGLDAFVLDATKTSDSDVIQHKFSYLRRIESAGTRLVAGVPVRYAPLRSWAAAPIGGELCRLESSDGSRGVIPMHPASWSELPVAAWARDIVDYARAWARVPSR